MAVASRDLWNRYSERMLGLGFTNTQVLGIIGILLEPSTTQDAFNKLQAVPVSFNGQDKVVYSQLNSAATRESVALLLRPVKP